MTIELSNICQGRIGELAIRAVNEANNLDIEMEHSDLTMSRVGGDYVLVKDIGDHAGVLLSKIDIQALFPKLVDLRPFKSKKHTPQVPRLNTHSEVERLRFNSKHKYGCNMVGSGHDVLRNPTTHDSDSLRDLILFCRVTGFWELDSTDLILGYSDNKLTITVVSSHPIYTGSIEVLV